MRYRGKMSAEERQIRSRLGKLVYVKPFVNGSLLIMKRTCGKKGCRCQKEGKKHVSLYLAYKDGKERKIKFVPKILENDAQALVARYKEFKKLSNIVSLSNLRHFFESK